MSNRRERGGRGLRQVNNASGVETMEERLCFSTYVVTGTGDGAGAVTRLIPGLYTATTLRAAVNAANSAKGADTILFNPLNSKPIVLTGGELAITDNLTIQGWGANVTKVDGGGASRVFNVAAGVTASINDVTIADGKVTGQGGGGVRNAGTLTLRGDAITNNAGDMDGAGVFNTGTITVIGSTFSGNTAGDGGGGLFTSGSASVVNSTFAKNAADLGGAIYNKSGGTLLVSDSTIATNHANSSGGGISATLADPNTMVSTTRLNNTIVAGNTYTPFTTNPDAIAQNPDLYGFFDSASSNNLIGYLGAAKGLDPSINLLGGINNATPGIDAKLSPLGNYGGTTQTMPPMAGSPAIDAGKNSLVPSGIIADQRGLPRVMGKAVDIGAAESLPAKTPSPSVFLATAIDGLIDKLKGLF